MTSLPFEKGLQSLHPFGREEKPFRRVRQDVTIVHNKTWSKK